MLTAGWFMSWGKFCLSALAIFWKIATSCDSGMSSGMQWLVSGFARAQDMRDPVCSMPLIAPMELVEREQALAALISGLASAAEGEGRVALPAAEATGDCDLRGRPLGRRSDTGFDQVPRAPHCRGPCSGDSHLSRR